MTKDDDGVQERCFIHVTTLDERSMPNYLLAEHRTRSPRYPPLPFSLTHFQSKKSTSHHASTEVSSLKIPDCSIKLNQHSDCLRC